MCTFLRIPLVVFALSLIHPGSDCSAQNPPIDSPPAQSQDEKVKDEKAKDEKSGVVQQKIQPLSSPAEYKFLEGIQYRYSFESKIETTRRDYRPAQGGLVLTLTKDPTEDHSLTRAAFEASRTSNQKESEKTINDGIVLQFLGTITDEMGQPTISNGILKMSSNGSDVTILKGRDHLLNTSTIATIAFPTLPPANQLKWSTKTKRPVRFLDPFKGSQTPALGQLPRPRGSILFNAALTTLEVKETRDYEIVEKTDDKLIVNYTFKSTWMRDPENTLFATCEGTGQYAFNRKHSIATAGFSKSNFVIDVEGIKTTIPTELAFKLTKVITAEEAKLQRQKAKIESEARKSDKTQGAIIVLKQKAATAKEAEDALKDLYYSNLSSTPEEELKKEVSSVLNHWLKSDDEKVSEIAVKVATKFATEKNLEALIKLYESLEGRERREVMKAIGISGGNEKSAKLLVDALKDRTLRYEAIAALKKMSKPAEDAVLPLLKSKDASTNQDALDILRQVGGKKSQAAIRQHLNKKKSNDFLTNLKAEQALRDINDRLAESAADQ